MTMHLAQGLNSSRSRKMKPKYTKANLKKWAVQLAVENKDRKRRGEERLSLDQYVDKIHGIVSTAPKDTGDYEPARSYADERIAENKKYQSLSTGVGNCSKKEPMKYSGERKLLGIGTMHKSNMVPIFDEEHAKDIAKMRRN